MNADTDEVREIAARLEAGARMRWIVVFGVYSREFVALPCFDVPSGNGMVKSLYPGAMHNRMKAVEARALAGRGSEQGSATAWP